MVANTPSSKLDYKTLCLFEVDEKLVVAFYRLKLPSQWNIHNDFQIFLLESYRGLKYPRRTEVPPTPDEVEGEYSHVLREIANSRWQYARHSKMFVEYRIVWEGYRSEDSWEPYEILQGRADEALKVFHQKYPQKHRKIRGNFMDPQNTA
ncbi:uncharacterized protein H6S33_001451 [Morchella sextelata]|uniref:uncharacterized protein n=1 Tax=Morchella sextelata TaxID=1174677 RepID=UPI001D057D2D|nr:uncharacterized protein H6S33_001451 [Morchella sextelata]KAH0609223.1 hypothetical protein H6S33_001451 [Morchella sextelata]